MQPPYFLYADAPGLDILEDHDEKVLLIGGDFNARNFGDILQQVNTISFHHEVGRYKCVALMGMGAVTNTDFPQFVRASSRADAIIFFSASPLKETASRFGLRPVHVARNLNAVHLYGGGFLNDKWGDIVLDVTEYFLTALHPVIYVASGQQITAPYQARVARHIETYRPVLFGVRDSLSQKCLSSCGHMPQYSFDDATEALQRLTQILPLQRGPGLLLQLNLSDYTNNVSAEVSLQADLNTLAVHRAASAGLTVLQAYSDRRSEVSDSRESIKYLERAFPFSDYRTLELSSMAYLSSGPLAQPVQGEVGYSCSYHVALWLQLAGIPCWLRGSNEFYIQKRQALQVHQELEAFLRTPFLADHGSNLVQRQEWIELLTYTLETAPTSKSMCVLRPPDVEVGSPEGGENQPCLARLDSPQRQLEHQASVREPDDSVDANSPSKMEISRLKAYANALNAQITELGAICHAQRHRAEAAEAELADFRRKPAILVDDTVHLRLELQSLNQAIELKDACAHDLLEQVASLNQAIEQKDACACDLREQVASLNQSIAQKDSQVRELAQELHRTRSEADSLFKQLDRVLHSHSWTITRPFRVAMRFVWHGHLDAAGEQGVFQLARLVGKRLPFPLWMKARVRAALLRWRFPKGDEFQARMQRPARLDGASCAVSGVSPKAIQMRPECCALQPGLVSVVLPVFNQAYMLEESIQSVLAQTYSNFELIVVNDGSTDDVEAVLERYLDHPKVRCYTQANQRLPKALSNGFSFATGEFWTWTSADNIMEPRMLELMVAKFQSEPALGMVYADYYAIDDRGILLEDKSWRAHNRPDPKSAEIRLPRTTKTLNTVQDNFIGPCFMYRGWIGRCLGDYDPQLGIEDYDYWMRINAFFELRHLGSDDLLYRYRVHDNTLSAQANEHGIHEKVQRLMDYEDERARFYRTAPSLLADAYGLDWLISSGAEVGTMRTLTDENDMLRLDEAGKVELLLMTSETAARHLSALATLPTPTAIIFSQDDLLYQKLQRLLKRPGCVALVPSRLVADRVRLVGSCPVVDFSANLSFAAVLAFAKNYLFFHATRTPAELERHLPRQLLKPAGRHVLLQVDSFIQGGMENVVIDLALSLQDTGFEVTIGILGKSGDAADKARDRKLRVESLPGGLSPEDYVAWLKSQRVSLVNAHYSIFGAAACKREGIPFIETIHNSYVWLDPEPIRQYREADAHITSYICVSNTAAQYADVVLGLDVSKMRVVPNGIDTGNIDADHFDSNRNGLRQEWQVGPDTTVFLNVASVMATKAQLPLVKAFAQVVKQHPDVRLVLLGSVMEKPYQRAIEQAIEDLKLQKQVIFAGYHRDVARYYHAADVFVLPSYWEGWSLSLGEAMANGLFCVITDVGSAYEFEGHDNVEIVSPPFGDITLLNYLNLGDFIYAEDENFERVLGEAMCKQIGRDRKACNIPLAAQLNRARAYEVYARIFSRY